MLNAILSFTFIGFLVWFFRQVSKDIGFKAALLVFAAMFVMPAITIVILHGVNG